MPDAHIFLIALAETLSCSRWRQGLDWCRRVWWSCSERPSTFYNSVKAADYTQIKDDFQAVQTRLIRWTQLRDPATATDGWGVLSPEMRASGNDAYQSIRSIARAAARLTPRASASTALTLFNFCSVLWKYAECMALELEASQDEVPVRDLLDRVNRGITDPWKAALTPSNIGNTEIGTHRLPEAPDPQDPAFWSRETEGQETDDSGWTEQDGGGEGDGGSGE